MEVSEIFRFALPTLLASLKIIELNLEGIKADASCLFLNR